MNIPHTEITLGTLDAERRQTKMKKKKKEKKQDVE